MTNHPFESFSLSGLDTSKVGNNKFIDYKVSDYLKDQNLKTSPRSIVAAIKQLDLDENLLKEVPSTTALGKVNMPVDVGATVMSKIILPSAPDGKFVNAKVVSAVMVNVW